MYIFPFFLKMSAAVEDQTTFLLHLDTTPHIQYASMNKLTLRNLTQQTKNSSIRGCSVSTLFQQGMRQMYNLLAFRFPEDITAESERKRETLLVSMHII